MTETIAVVAAKVGIIFGLALAIGWMFSMVFRWIASFGLEPGLVKQLQIAQRRLIIGCLALATGLSFLVIIGNVVFYSQGGDIADEIWDALRDGVPFRVWQYLGLGLAQTILVAIGTGLGLLLIDQVLAWACNYTKNIDEIEENNDSIEKLFQVLQGTITVTLWSTVFISGSYFLGFPDAVSRFFEILLSIYIIVNLGRILMQFSVVTIDSLDSASTKYVQTIAWLRYYENLRHLVPSFKRTLEFIIWVAVGILVVEQIDLISNLSEYGYRIVRIIVVVFLARLLVEIAKIAIFEVMLNPRDLTPTQTKRRQTLCPLFQSVARYGIYFVAGVFILDALTIDPTPVLAGLGILSLTLGFAVNNLIQDFVSGFFILLEGYYLVGEFVQTPDAKGIVESIDLRTTRIRDLQGQVNIIRNGRMEPIINFSRDYLVAVVDVGVAYESDMERVHQVLLSMEDQLKAEYGDQILAPMTVVGPTNFGESDLTFKTIIKVEPSFFLRGGMENYIRRLIKTTFDREGIEIPYPRRVIISNSAPA